MHLCLLHICTSMASYCCLLPHRQPLYGFCPTKTDSYICGRNSVKLKLRSRNRILNLKGVCFCAIPTWRLYSFEKFNLLAQAHCSDRTDISVNQSCSVPMFFTSPTHASDTDRLQLTCTITSTGILFKPNALAKTVLITICIAHNICLCC